MGGRKSHDTYGTKSTPLPCRAHGDGRRRVHRRPEFVGSRRPAGNHPHQVAEVAEEFLRADGFTDVHYLPFDVDINLSKAIARGEIDLSLSFSPALLIPIDAGERITFIAGVHAGCFDLFAGESIRTIADLKGKMVGVDSLGP